jgi:hypothetical protein
VQQFTNEEINTRRRRRETSSEADDDEPPQVQEQDSTGLARRGAEVQETNNQAGGGSRSRRERPSSPKRPRFMSKEMRLDPDKTTSSTNGHAFKSGSTTSSLQKISQSASTNGFALTPSGSSYTNGSNPTLAKQKSRTYFGHDREEVTRLLIQALTDLGYHESADKLVQESGFELESPTVAAFRHSVLDGEWREAEYLLFGTSHQDEGGVSLINGHSNPLGGLVLAEGVDKNELLFKLRRQKYLELLEARDTGAALMVLRQELTPLHQDVAQLHILSGYVALQSQSRMTC